MMPYSNIEVHWAKILTHRLFQVFKNPFSKCNLGFAYGIALIGIYLIWFLSRNFIRKGFCLKQTLTFFTVFIIIWLVIFINLNDFIKWFLQRSITVWNAQLAESRTQIFFVFTSKICIMMLFTNWALYSSIIRLLN